MNCPKCHAENPDNAQICSSCSAILSAAAATRDQIVVKTSGTAIAALVLGILSFVLVALAGIPAVICGIVALVQIDKSGGRLTGRGFAITGIVLPVVSFILALAVLMPALARVRQISYRLYCGTNLSGIGKAMLIYSNDYDDEMPKAGGRNSVYATAIANWRNVTRQQAFGLAADGSGGTANITSCFYLLIKYSEVTPKSFLCKGDSTVTEFKPSDEGITGRELIDLWDFGPVPTQAHCSYAYHFPYGVYALTSSSEPGMAVAADPNPWQYMAGHTARPATDWNIFKAGTDRDSIKKGNAQTHQEDGQNVLFMDGHSSFEKSPRCGVDDDNIYTRWFGTGATANKQNGTYPVVVNAAAVPADRTDSWLVTDGAGSATTTTTTTAR